MKKLLKKLILPLCQSPIGYKIRGYIFNFKEKISGYPKLKKKFKNKLGYELDLKNPKSFNQKICWKKVYDRNPLLPIVADKYKVREYIKNILGEEEANKILIPLLYVTDKPETIPFNNLPEEYIIKANHGSGTNIIIEKNKPINKKEIIKQCQEWLNKPYGLFKHEWAYQKIKRKIIIEKLLRDENGEIPKDYKFHMFNGVCKLIQVDINRFTDLKRSLFTNNWEILNITLKHKKGNFIKKPIVFQEMKEIVKKLSQKFDYIRVDLYLNEKKIHLGELTNYPASGSAKINPQSFDFKLGEHWQIMKKYWKK